MKISPKDIPGLLFCIAGSLILLYLFPFIKILILIPIVLFVTSVFIKNWKVAILLNSITAIPFVIVYLGLRIPAGKSIEFESRIRYQMVDLGQYDFIRNGIELKLNNRRVFLADTINGINWVYVNESDFKKLWPEPPFVMRERNYTVKARFKTYKLITGGYSTAEIVKLDLVNGNPMITK